MGTALPLHGHLHMLPWSLGIQHHREAAFCFLPTQQPGKIASCTVLACLVTNKLTLSPEKPTAKENCFWSVMSDVKKDKGRLTLKIQVQATIIVIHRPQRPQHQLLSSLSSATLHSAIADEYQVLQLLFLLKVQKHQ